MACKMQFFCDWKLHVLFGCSYIFKSRYFTSSRVHLFYLANFALIEDSYRNILGGGVSITF